MSKEQKLLELQKQIRFKINQAIEEFQVDQGVKITAVDIDLIDLSTVDIKMCVVSKVILRTE